MPLHCWISKLNSYREVADDYCTYGCRNGTLTASSTSNLDLCDTLKNVFCCAKNYCNYVSCGDSADFPPWALGVVVVVVLLLIVCLGIYLYKRANWSKKGGNYKLELRLRGNFPLLASLPCPLRSPARFAPLPASLPCPLRSPARFAPLPASLPCPLRSPARFAPLPSTQQLSYHVLMIYIFISESSSSESGQ